MTPVDRLLATARAEEGYIEKASNAQLDSKTGNAGRGNWNKYARDLDNLGMVYNGPKNGFDWCDIFADWCYISTFGLRIGMQLTCQEEKGFGAGCTYSARYYKAKGRWYTSDPQPGDQIFFTKNAGKTFYHTGIVEKVTRDKVYTIEGNTSSTGGVVENGGGVARKSYALNYSRIGGYGRPDWSIIITTESEEDDMASLEQFKQLWYEMRKELQDNDSSEYSDAAKAFIKDNGIMAGAGPMPDGQPNYMWEDVLTREQLACVLYRFAQWLGKV